MCVFLYMHMYMWLLSAARFLFGPADLLAIAGAAGSGAAIYTDTITEPPCTDATVDRLT